MFKQFVEKAPIAVALFDRDMLYLAHSSQWLIEHELGQIALLGKSYYDTFIEIAPHCAADCQKVLNEGVSASGDCDWKNKNGITKAVRYTITPWKDNARQVSGIVMWTTSIEYLRIQKELQKRNEELQSLLDAFPDLMFRLSQDGTFLDYKIGIKAPRYPPDFFIGRKIKEVFPAEWANQQLNLLAECLEHGLVQGEYSLPAEDSPGLEHFETRFVPMKDNEVLVVVRDITALTNAKNQLEQSITDLTRSNQDLEQFATIASHDLKEPVRIIGTFAQILKEKYSDKLDATGQQYLGFITNSAKRMELLIQCLLDYSKLATIKLDWRVISVNEIIQQQLTALQIRIDEKNAQINCNNLPQTIFGEPTLVGILFYNLLNNAIKFNHSEPPIININYQETSEHYLFSISDNGIGLSQEFSEKVFKIFYRLHRQEKYEGAGIGLATCQRIVHHHGGKIWYQLNPHQGTTFFFTIKKQPS